TTIEYSLSTSCYVDVSVYNLLGQKVKNLVDEMKSIGEHKITWDGTDCDGVEVASGVYFYRITAGDEVASKKMMLIR
ncbi:MAG: T9SS type A sorting domain-containing protein, partial [candidate division Zixibacteria bacterium]|nr:T9SS type A sorting domain-containing protein [candidate division Zixibacteria bacterium]